MEKDLQVGIMLIQNLLEIRITVCDIGSENFILPSLYLGKNEKKIIKDIVAEMPEKSICFLKDHFCVSYCIVCIQSQLLILGPYRNLLEIAMHNAGVPIPAYAKLAREFQLNCRRISKKVMPKNWGLSS